MDGKLCAVRINLFNFLERVWALPDIYGEITLWIDQICIDQSTVAQMSRIFRQAERVLVWLGSASPRAKRLMVDLNDLPPILPRHLGHDMTTGMNSYPHSFIGADCGSFKRLFWHGRLWLFGELSNLIGILS